MKFTTLLIATILSISCYQALADYAFTPSPEELLVNAAYLEQVLEIDEERVKLDLEPLTDLILQGRVTREDNGTEPIVIEIVRVRPEEGEILLDENGEILIDPLHDKIEVEEYFVLPAPQMVENLNHDTIEIEKIVSELLELPETPFDEADETEDEMELHAEPSELEVPSEDNGETNGFGSPHSYNSSSASYITQAALVMGGASGSNFSEYTEFLTEVDYNSDMQADWDGRKDGPVYTELTLEALDVYGQNLLNPNLKMNSGGYSRYCKRYNSLNREERKQFWLMFISGLTRMESGFRPERQYKESFKYKGKNVYSRGLLQMSIGSVNQDAYGCDIGRAQDLHKPGVNIACAVRIMNFWVKKDRAIYGVKPSGSSKTDWLGVANYWAPIRLEKYRGSKRTKHERLGNMINAMSICR